MTDMTDFFLTMKYGSLILMLLGGGIYASITLLHPKSSNTDKLLAFIVLLLIQLVTR